MWIKWLIMVSKYTSTFKKEKNVWLIPISNARFFYFFLKETEARGRNRTPSCCLKGRQILVQHHKQHTLLHSWNSDKNQFRLAAGGKKTSKKEAPGSSRLEFPLWLVYWIIQKLPFLLLFFVVFYSSQHGLTDHTCVCNFTGHTPLIFIGLTVLHSVGSRARACHEENWHPSTAFQQSNNLLDLRIQQVTDFFFPLNLWFRLKALTAVFKMSY